MKSQNRVSRRLSLQAHSLGGLPHFVSINELLCWMFALVCVFVAIERRANYVLRQELKAAHGASSETNSVSFATTVLQQGKRIADLEEHLGAAERATTDSDKKRSQLEGRFLNVQAERSNLARELAEVRELADLRLKTIGLLNEEIGGMNSDVIRQELLGIEGSLESVVFAFDTSGSMRESGRWEHAVNLVSQWIEYLPVERCRLVLFNDMVSSVPPDGSWLEMTGSSRSSSKAVIAEALSNVRPGGYTNTKGALEAAFEVADVTSIILLTDGAPMREKLLSTRAVRREMDAVIEFCREVQWKGVPINSVGLGDYFEPDVGNFMMELARMTGGTFIGR